MAGSFIRMSISEDIKAELSKMQLEQILNSIEKAAAPALEKNIKISWNELRKESLNFLSAINSLEEEYINFTAAQLKNVVVNPEIASYADQMQKRKEDYYVQSLYMLAARFEEFLSRFREEDKERSVLYVFTNENSGAIETYEMTFRELILNADKHGRWSDISKVRLTNNDRVSKEEGLFNDDHIIEAKNAYQGTFNRWSRYFEVHKVNQKQNGLILWKEQKKWMVGNIVNTGDLKEAYTAFLFTEHEKDLLCMLDNGQPPYYSHEFIGTFFKNYVNKVTNLEAIIEEDVLTTDKQYGVKGRKASLPSLQQFIDVASIIIGTGNNILTKEELENKINEKFKKGDESKGARNIYKIIDEAIDIGKITKEEFEKISKIIS